MSVVWIKEWWEATMVLPGMMPEYIDMFGISISQTLLTGIISTYFFLIFVLIYNYLRMKNEKNIFVQVVDMFVEWILNFFEDLAWWLPEKAKLYIVFLFFYILWNNFFWLVWDMFATVVPSLHHIFRPVATDVAFNAILAIIAVIWSLIYWLQKGWIHFIQKYINFKWVWFVDKIQWVWSFIVKIFDVILGFFIGFLEMIWELTKMLSLSLRLFWNIFAWVILLTLIVNATQSFMTIPLIAPLLVVFMETIVWFLQAFVFALLVIVYFKMAEVSH